MSRRSIISSPNTALIPSPLTAWVAPRLSHPDLDWAGSARVLLRTASG